MPNYNNEKKAMARALLIEDYKRCTGKSSIPRNKSYWSLCNLQEPYEPLCEIEQMSRSGFISPTQYHGVDYIADIIKANEKKYPQANWYHGSWFDIVLHHKFNPSLVHLDTLWHGNSPEAIETTLNTMRYCPSETLMAVNVIAASYGHTNLDSNFFSEVSQRVDQNLWTPVRNYEYAGSPYTTMHMYFFYKH